MSALPIIHFSGRFRFHMPEYNNRPQLQGVDFDPTLQSSEVKKLCGCDPARYFEFEFFDTTVTRVTRTDLSLADASELLLGKKVGLSSLMVDISPSAICAQIHAGSFTLHNLPPWKMSVATQSDLRLNIRKPGDPVQSQFSDETAGAWFDAELTVPPLTQSTSEVLTLWRDAGVQKLHIRFHLNRYTRLDNAIGPDEARLTGDVYGYLRAPVEDASLPDGSRVRGRRIIAHPSLRNHPDTAAMFLADPRNFTDPASQVNRRTDIDGTYDLVANDSVLLLHPLDFISFVDRNGTTPSVDRYLAYLETGATRTPIGEFRGTHDEFKANGGLIALKLPADVSDTKLSIDVRLLDGSEVPLMRDPEWDIVTEGSRGAIIASGESVEFKARVFRNNKPAPGVTVTHRTEAANRRSPVVAKVAQGSSVSDAEGRITAVIQGLDLENAPAVFDPVVGSQVSGDLAWDRYYGNFCFLSIPNPERWTLPDAIEEIELAVRVVHKIDPAQMPDTPGFTEHILPLLSYYVRYFPWLHTRQNGPEYERFLDLSSFEDAAGDPDGIIQRLSRNEDSRSKMPRSRDFPKNGVELLKRWRDTGLNP